MLQRFCSTASTLVRELCALLVAKMPAEQAEAPPWVAPDSTGPAGLDARVKAFTLVIPIDAWNIRERDH